MSNILTNKITATRVLKGTKPEEHLPVISKDFNSLVDDAVALDARITTLELPVKARTASAINVTATVTAAQLATGYITSTSAAAVTATLPTATLLATQLGAAAGGSFTFIVDNTAGANTVTVAVGSGIVVAKQTSSGDTAVDQLLTVAASSTVGVGVFRVVFTSATAAVLFRI